jgi:hypothetical protein
MLSGLADSTPGRENANSDNQKRKQKQNNRNKLLEFYYQVVAQVWQ